MEEFVTFGEKLENVGHYIQENSYVNCVVTEVQSPLSSYVKLFEFSDQLEFLQIGLKHCYDSTQNENVPPVLKSKDKVPGMFVAVQHDTPPEWYRGQIVRIDGATGSCQVRSIDFGWTVTCDSNELRYLTRNKFGTLKAQGVKCKLVLHPLHEEYIGKVISKGFLKDVLDHFHGIVFDANLAGVFRRLTLEGEDLVWEVELSILEKEFGSDKIEIKSDVASLLIEMLQTVHTIESV